MVSQVDPTIAARTALRDVRVFDGRRLLPPATVVIEAGRIGTDAEGAQVVDGEGGVLLPGLIDAHVHIDGRESLDRLRDFGVTTVLDMASPPHRLEALRGTAGGTDFRTAGVPAIAPGSMHSRMPVIGELGLLPGAEQAAAFVAARVADGVDYLKIIVGDPGPSHDEATLAALVAAAHEHGLRTVAHAASYPAVAMALGAGVDVLTHEPLDRAVDEDMAAAMLAAGRIAIPTLTMMAAVAASGRPGTDYQAARRSVATLYRAGVPILAGTDANAGGGPVTIEHGESLHRELELLVDAGLSTLDALRAATSLPAHYFDLADRGMIEPGRRADLVLVDGDPLADISATRSIRRVWCAGVEHARV